MAFIFERVESVGLAHYSYFLAADGEGVVIDPRRDVDAYVRLASGHGVRIDHVLETHRHEDFVTGSVELARRTGAQVWHADGESAAYAYGESVRDGQEWPLAGRTLQAVATPGHTPGHTAYVLREVGGVPIMLFSGDALMAGELGRTDLDGDDTAEESSARLYDSVVRRLLPLGDGVVLCPAHGAGSACGAAIVERPWTTIGLEWRLNPKLSMRRDEFIELHTAESVALDVPPYFARVRRLNVDPPALGGLPLPEPLSPEAFSSAAERGAQVLDVRSLGDFAAGHVPDALFIQLDELGTWGGWMLDAGRPILLVTPSADATEAVVQLVRMGFDELAGTLDGGGVMEWLQAGRPGSEYGTPDARELRAVLDGDGAERRHVGCGCAHAHAGESPLVLDVRTAEELAGAGWIDGARHIPLRELPGRLAEIPRGGAVAVVCGSGMRSMTAASLLERAGLGELDVLYGGIPSWVALGYPLVREREAVGVP